jgi:uncharacterized phage protein (TIGR02220 family)
MADKKSFIIYFNWAQMLRDMPDPEAGQLIKGIAAYELGEEVSFDNPLLSAVFSMIKGKLDEDNERYKERVKKIEESKRRWWEEKKAQEAKSKTENDRSLYTSIDEYRSLYKGIDNYSDTVTDTVNVTVTDTDTVTDVTNVTNNNKIRSPAEPDITAEVVDYLNQKLGTRYKAETEKTKRLIRARIREGATLEDFRKVIDKKVKEWRGTKLEPYLRPETLFGAKFESYLNQGTAGTRTGNGSFTDFEQRNYDFDALEKALEG